MHFKRICVCGNVIAQCRCLGSKVVTTVKPCRCERPKVQQTKDVKPDEGPRYCLWSYGPTGEICMVDRALHQFICKRIDVSDDAHYGAGSWCYMGLMGSVLERRKVSRVLNTEADVIAAELSPVPSPEEIAAMRECVEAAQFDISHARRYGQDNGPDYYQLTMTVKEFTGLQQSLAKLAEIRGGA